MPQDRFVIPVLETLFRENAVCYTLMPGVDLDTFATTFAWAIFGAASRWAQTKDRRPAEQMAKTIESLIKPLMSAEIAAESCKTDSVRALIEALASWSDHGQVERARFS